MLHTSGVDAELALVFDPDPDKAAAFAARSGARVAASVDEVLDGVDAVYVTSWTYEHRALVEAVVARGLPVFCEKPLATTVADTVAMIDAVEAAGVVNQVGLVLRDSPAFNFLRHLIRWPASGRLMNVVFRRQVIDQGHYASRGGRTRPGPEAGTLIGTIHDLDLSRWLRARRQRGGSPRSSTTSPARGPAVATLAFTWGGALHTSVWHDILGSRRCASGVLREHHYVLEGDVGPVRWTLDGDEGSLEARRSWPVAELGIEVQPRCGHRGGRRRDPATRRSPMRCGPTWWRPPLPSAADPTNPGSRPRARRPPRPVWPAAPTDPGQSAAIVLQVRRRSPFHPVRSACGA
jgi:predicted dehydrogenase